MCNIVTTRTLVCAQYRGTDAFLILQSKQNRLKDRKVMCVCFYLYIYTYVWYVFGLDTCISSKFFIWSFKVTMLNIYRIFIVPDFECDLLCLCKYWIMVCFWNVSSDGSFNWNLTQNSTCQGKLFILITIKSHLQKMERKSVRMKTSLYTLWIFTYLPVMLKKH